MGRRYEMCTIVTSYRCGSSRSRLFELCNCLHRIIMFPHLMLNTTIVYRALGVNRSAISPLILSVLGNPRSDINWSVSKRVELVHATFSAKGGKTRNK